MTNLSNKNLISSLVFIFLIWSLYFLRSIICPFIFSIIIAYCFNPLVVRLDKKYKLSRLTSSLLIVLILLILLIIILTILLPIIFQQLLEFCTALGNYFKVTIDKLYPKIIDFSNSIGIKLDGDFKNLIDQKIVNDHIFGLSGNILSNAISSSLNAIDITLTIFITPILIFYFLKDWEIITATIYDNLPKNIAMLSKKIFTDINLVLLGYVRGELNICLILALFYSISLTIAHLNFGFLIGLFAGFIAFIPYIGATFSIALAIIVALFQWGFDVTNLVIIAVIFIVGHLVESNFLTPKLIGSRVGLHPLWIIFGLFVFAKLLGFAGILLAVPLTAIAGVIIKSLIKNLKYNGRLYH
jgi:putative permease